MVKKPKQPRLKRMTYKDYNAEMEKIIHKHDNVADSLIEMLEFCAKIKLVSDKTKNHEKTKPE